MFDLELERVVTEIKKKKAKIVLIQLPDGLKTQSKLICDAIEQETKAAPLIWLSSCFGACDMPLGIQKMNIDLLIQWGHNPYHKSRENW